MQGILCKAIMLAIINVEVIKTATRFLALGAWGS